MATKTPASPARRGGVLKKLLVGIVVAIVLLVAGVWLFGLRIASGFVKSAIESAAGNSIQGRVDVGSIDLAWTGPQRVGNVVLRDPAGAVVGTFDLDASTSLIGVALGGRDLGAIKLSGKLDVKEDPAGGTNLQRAIAARPGPATGPGAAPPATSTPAEPFRLPKDLRFRVDVDKLEATFTTAAKAGQPSRVIGVKDLTASAAFANASPVTAEIKGQVVGAQPRPLSATLKADKLTNPDGSLALDSATLDASISAGMAATDVDALAGMFLAAPAGAPPVAAAPADQSLEVSGGVRISNGRLVLADPAKPFTVRTLVPDAALRSASQGEITVAFSGRPGVSFTVTELDVPLRPGSAGAGVDLRGSRINAVIATTDIAGTLKTPADDRPRNFRVSPGQFTLSTPDLKSGLGLIGRVTTQYDGVDAGAISVDLSAAEPLDSQGRLAIGDKGMPAQGAYRGKITLDRVPVALLQPFASRVTASDGRPLDLAQALGDAVTVELKAGVVTAADIKSRSGTSPEAAKSLAEIEPGSLYLSATLASPKTSLWLDASYDIDRVQSREKGLKVQSEAAGYLLRAFGGPDLARRLSGDGLAVIDVPTFFVPIVRGQPDLARTSASATVAVGELRLSLDDPARSAGTPPLNLQSIDTRVSIDPGKSDPTVKLDWRIDSGGQPMRALGEMRLPGLIVPGKQPGTVAIGPLQPVGAIEVTGVPTRLAALAGPDAERQARAVLGDALQLRVEGLPGASPGANTARLSLQSPGLNASGVLSLEKIGENGLRIRTAEQSGFTAELLRPAEALNAVAAAPAPGSAPPARFRGLGGAGLVRLVVSGLDAEYQPGRPLLPTFTAAARAEVAELGASVDVPGAGPQDVGIRSLTADLAWARGGSGTVKLTSSAENAGRPMQISSDLKFSGMLNAAGAIDATAASISGPITLANVPVALAAPFLKDNTRLVSELVGEALDLNIAADSRPGPSGPTRSAQITAKSPRLQAATSATLAGDALSVGPTKVDAQVTPGLVDAAAARFAPTLSPRPALGAPARLTVEASPVSIALNTPPGQPAPLPIPATAAITSADDLVLRNLPLGQQPGDLGLRGLRITSSAAGGGASNLALAASVFDPATGEPVGQVEGGGRYPIDAGAPLNLKIANGNAAALDRMLRRNGLIEKTLGGAFSLDAGITPAAGGAQNIAAKVQSPKLQAAAALRYAPGSIQRTGDTRVQWTLDPQVAEALLAPGDGSPAPIAINEPVRIDANVERLALPLAQGGGGLELSAKLATSPVTFLIREEPQASGPAGVLGQLGGARAGARAQQAPSVPVPLGALQGSAQTAGPGVVQFQLQNAAGPDASRINATGQVVGLQDAAGNFSTDAARVTAQVKGDLPTALLDALGKQQGRLLALLGPRVVADIQTQQLALKPAATPGDGGAIAAVFRATDYGSADISGRITNGVFTSAPPTDAKLTRISPDLSRRMFSKIMPFLTVFEKRPGDERPTVVTVDSIAYPLSGDLRSLNGKVRFDLGEMSFQSSEFMGQVLSGLGGKAGGKVFQRIQPFDITITNGVARYGNVAFPVGEFNLIIERAAVDIPTSTIQEMIILVPAERLAQSILGGKKTQAGATIPMTLSGPTDSPKISIDAGKLIEENIRNVGGDLLNDLLKPRKK
ncbi:MAG: hypothetical protein IBJ11_03410 [Phycisphaerales bacterium]|nr:hypothetical protein [Phycisphaerales bacterium]